MSITIVDFNTEHNGETNQLIPRTTLHAAHYYDMSFAIGLLLFAAQLSWPQTACNTDHIPPETKILILKNVCGAYISLYLPGSLKVYLNITFKPI